MEKVEGARNFANKLWNASRFAIMNIKDEEGNFLPIASEEDAKLQAEDRWILQTINDALPEINQNMERFEFALAAQKIYELIWGEFCDWYIELIKPRLYGEDEADKASARYCLVKCLKSLLKLLHPFMPFITEEIWSFLPKDADAKQFLMLEGWPEYDASMNYAEDKAVLNLSMDIIRAIRGIRHEAEALPSRKLHAVILAEADQEKLAKAGERYIKTLGNLEGLDFVASKDALPEETMSAALPGLEVYVPLDDLMDYEAEYARLTKEKERLTKEVARVTNQLANEKFVSRAPAHVIQAERDKLAGYQDMLEKTLARIPVVEKKLNK